MEPIAVITGADRGLGFALCERLLEKGWCVFAGQFMPSWPQLAGLSERYPEKLHVIPLDVSSNESVKAAAMQVSLIVDHVDMLINNAGIISRYNELDIREQLNYEDMHRIYDVNALGPIRMVEAFLPLMDKGRLKRLQAISSWVDAHLHVGREKL